MSKPKFPRAVAMDVAAQLCRALKLATDRLVVAGSLRRLRPEVGDVEILYIPKFDTVQDGLFDTKQVNLADSVIEQLLSVGELAKRENVNGGTAWGQKNKLARHVRSGIPVDLFEATTGNWFNYLVCRTGSANHNLRIAQAAQDKGWKWHPYGEGFTDLYGDLVRVESEQDVFRLVGLPYLEPKER